MIPTNYTIIRRHIDPNPAEVFFAYKRYTCCNSGLKYPVMVAQIPEYGYPVVLVANTKEYIPLPFANCTATFEISFSKNPEVLTPDTCRIDDRDVLRVKEWIVKNYDTIELLIWMYDTQNIISFIDNETGITYTHSKILNSMKRSKRKTKRRLK